MNISKGEKIFGVINIGLMLFIIVVCVYPIVYVLFASLSSSDLLMAHRGILVKPLGASLDAYIKVFHDPLILTGYMNTLTVVFFGVILNMIMTILGAYFLSRKNVQWQKPIFLMIIFTMYFSGGLVPFYLTVKSLGFEDTLLALIVPTAVNTFNLIIMRTGFYSIPDSLEESAMIDGANHFTILLKVCIPLIKPIIAVIVLYYAVERWNAWFYASIFLNDARKYPLQLILRQILISNDTNSMTGNVGTGDIQSVAETIKYAVIVVATLPILCLYPFLQKYFVQGVLVGAVKG